MEVKNLHFFDKSGYNLNFEYNSYRDCWVGNIYLPPVSVGLYTSTTIYVLEEIFQKTENGFEKKLAFPTSNEHNYILVSEDKETYTKMYYDKQIQTHHYWKSENNKKVITTDTVCPDTIILENKEIINPTNPYTKKDIDFILVENDNGGYDKYGYYNFGYVKGQSGHLWGKIINSKTSLKKSNVVLTDSKTPESYSYAFDYSDPNIKKKIINPAKAINYPSNITFQWDNLNTFVDEFFMFTFDDKTTLKETSSLTYTPQDGPNCETLLVNMFDTYDVELDKYNSTQGTSTELNEILTNPENEEYYDIDELDNETIENIVNTYKETQNKTRVLPIHIAFSSPEHHDATTFCRTLIMYCDDNEIARITFYAETIEEDERLKTWNENLGYDINKEDIIIFKDSNINECRPDYKLLNEKRKELMMEGHNIFPYIGSYKAIINVIKFFGYNNLGLVEFWKNINTSDPNFGKLYHTTKYSLTDKEFIYVDSNKIPIPNKNYRKTNKIILTYTLNSPTNEVDEFELPDVEENFNFTIEEVMIKLFALRNKLNKTFMPVSSRITDIVGTANYFGINLIKNNITIRTTPYEKMKRQMTINVFPSDNLYLTNDRFFNEYVLESKGAIGTDQINANTPIKNILDLTIPEKYNNYIIPNLITINGIVKPDLNVNNYTNLTQPELCELFEQFYEDTNVTFMRDVPTDNLDLSEYSNLDNPNYIDIKEINDNDVRYTRAYYSGTTKIDDQIYYKWSTNEYSFLTKNRCPEIKDKIVGTYNNQQIQLTTTPTRTIYNVEKSSDTHLTDMISAKVILENTTCSQMTFDDIANYSFSALDQNLYFSHKINFYDPNDIYIKWTVEWNYDNINILSYIDRYYTESYFVTCYQIDGEYNDKERYEYYKSLKNTNSYKRRINIYRKIPMPNKIYEIKYIYTAKKDKVTYTCDKSGKIIYTYDENQNNKVIYDVADKTIKYTTTQTTDKIEGNTIYVDTTIIDKFTPYKQIKTGDVNDYNKVFFELPYIGYYDVTMEIFKQNGTISQTFPKSIKVEPYNIDIRGFYYDARDIPSNINATISKSIAETNLYILLEFITESGINKYAKCQYEGKLTYKNNTYHTWKNLYDNKIYITNDINPKTNSKSIGYVEDDVVCLSETHQIINPYNPDIDYTQTYILVNTQKPTEIYEKFIYVSQYPKDNKYHLWKTQNSPNTSILTTEKNPQTQTTTYKLYRFNTFIECESEIINIWNFINNPFDIYNNPNDFIEEYPQDTLEFFALNKLREMTSLAVQEHVYQDNLDLTMPAYDKNGDPIYTGPYCDENINTKDWYMADNLNDDIIKLIPKLKNARYIRNGVDVKPLTWILLSYEYSQIAGLNKNTPHWTLTNIYTGNSVEHHGKYFTCLLKSEGHYKVNLEVEDIQGNKYSTTRNLIVVDNTANYTIYTPMKNDYDLMISEQETKNKIMQQKLDYLMKHGAFDDEPEMENSTI